MCMGVCENHIFWIDTKPLKCAFCEFWVDTCFLEHRDIWGWGRGHVYPRAFTLVKDRILVQSCSSKSSLRFPTLSSVILFGVSNQWIPSLWDLLNLQPLIEHRQELVTLSELSIATLMSEMVKERRGRALRNVRTIWAEYFSVYREREGEREIHLHH